MTKDEARRIAVNIAKLAELLFVAISPETERMLTGMVKIIAAVLMLVTCGNAIAGDNGSSDPAPPSHPAQVSMQASDWTLEHSPSLPQMEIDWFRRHTRPSPDTRLSHPSPDNLGWSLSLDSLLEVEPSIPLIELPNLEVNTIPGLKFFSFFVTTASPILTQGHYVKMAGGIAARGDVILDPSWPRGSPAWCRMYFQEAGDDRFSTESRYLYYRWWSTDFLVLHRGHFVQVVGLEPEFWANLTGERGDKSAAATAGFQQALANPQHIGIMCRGAYVDGGGDFPRRAVVEPRFSMFSLAVCDPFRQLRRGPFRDAADAFNALRENAPCEPPGRR